MLQVLYLNHFVLLRVPFTSSVNETCWYCYFLIFLQHHQLVFCYISTLESLLFTSDIDIHILEVFQQFCALRSWNNCSLFFSGCVADWQNLMEILVIMVLVLTECATDTSYVGSYWIFKQTWSFGISSGLETGLVWLVNVATDSLQYFCETAIYFSRTNL